MSNRKFQITLFAIIAAIGIAIAPGTAAAGPSNQAEAKSDAAKQNSKSDKDDDKNDKWEKLRRQVQYQMYQFRKQYENKKASESSNNKQAYQKPPQTQTAAAKPATATATAAKPASSTSTATGPCTCLTKEYTSDGRVLFKDTCTKEVAVYSKDESN